MSTAQLDDILRKVQALISRADHPNTPPAEAEAARAKAEMLMLKYRIEETQLGDAGKLQGFVPVWRTITLVDYRSEFRRHYQLMMQAIIEHLDIRGLFLMTHTAGQYKLVAEIVGYESDLRFAELLFTQCALAFSKRLEPVYDPELSDQLNAYLLRMAGMEGRRIAMAIYGSDVRNLRPKVRAMFKKEALARGENPDVLLGKGNSVKTFRTSYAEGFVSELYNRMWTMRTARSGDGTLVLKSRREAVDEAFYTKYPQYRPVKFSGEVGSTATAEPCQKCAKAKSGYCREHNYRRPVRQKDPAFNTSAYLRGQQAAKDVDLSGS